MMNKLKTTSVCRSASIQGMLFLAMILTGSGAMFYLYLVRSGIVVPRMCDVYRLTGFYCPGCGAGRASYSLLHGRFLDAFCYNPVMTVLLPLLALYVAARAIDWAITGGDHIDQKISVKFVAGILIFVLLFGIVRNIPVYPFNLLVPGGLFELF